MANFIRFTIIFLLSFFLQSKQNQLLNPNNKQQVLSNRQFLVQAENFYVLNFQLTNQLLPQSLVRLFVSWNLTQIELNMGYLNKKSITFDVPVDKGISILVSNNSKLQESMVHQLGQVFLISRKPQFQIYLSEMNATYISNPNDKFCSQHLTNLIKYFLPCGLNKGISELLNEKQQFQRNFFSVNIFWTQRGIKLKYVIDKEKDTIRKVRSLKHKNGCKIFDQSFFIEEDQKLTQQNSLITKIQADDANIVQSFTKSNWYGNRKRIITKINFKDSHSRGYASQVHSIKIRYLLPKGFVLFSIQTNQKDKLYKTSIKKAQAQYEQSIVVIQCQMNQESLIQQIIVTLNVQATFKGFQNYENIAGGGEEFVRVPILIYLKNETQIWISNDPISQHLLQPDFSIPFQTITFAVVIFGYLWIAIWRSLAEQDSTKGKKVEPQKPKKE